MSESPARSSLLRFLPRNSLRAKVTIGVVLPLILVLSVFTALEYQRYQSAALTHLSKLASQNGQIIEDNLRQQMLKTDIQGMQKFLDAISRRDDFRIIYLLDTSGKVIFAPFGEGVGRRLNNQRVDCQPCHSLPVASRPSSVIVTAEDGERVFRTMNPIENSPECSQCHDASQHLIGLLLTDIPTAPFEAALRTDLRENLLWGVAMIVVVVIVVNFALSHFVLARMERFATAFRELGHGQLPDRLPGVEKDEIGALERGFNRMAGQIQTRDVENRALSESLQRQIEQRGELLKRLITAQENERKRVARELHDQLGQTLSGLSLQAQVIQKLILNEPSHALKQLKVVRELIAESTEQMYDLILALRPSILDDMGLVPALRTHCERVLKEAGISYELDSNLGERLPLELETSLYRIFQETISNVVRHSQASHVNLVLTRQDGLFQGQIEDDGLGFDPAVFQVNGDQPQGLGLLGMQERVSQCGGKMLVISSPGKGTKIQISIPING